MGGIFGGGKSTSTTEQVLAGMQLQTSCYGGPVPVAYGTNRFAGNLVDYDDFTPIPHTTTTKTGKGGGGGSTISNTSYTYTAMVVIALSEGPDSSINQVWRDKDKGSLTGWGFSLLLGSRPQTAWSYLTTKHPSKAVGYSGLALVAHAAVDLGGSGSLKNYSFEVIGLLASEQDPAALTAFDARPHAVITDMLSNTFYGVAGFDSSRIADLVTGAGSYYTYCKAAGLVISPVFDTQAPASKHIDDVLTATNSAPVWSAGPTGGMQLKIVPFGDQPITANGVTFTPNTTPLYDLTYDDFLDTGISGTDPISISRTSNQDVMNCCPVEYLDRMHDYNVSIVDDPDPVDVAVSGLKKAQPVSLHMITQSSVALQVSRILAQRQVYVRNQYTFRVGWKYILLEPMDLVTITDPILGLDHKIVRIVNVDMPDESVEEQGLTITAEEWPFGTGTATLYTVQSPGGTVPNVNADPGNAAAPVIFDAPALLRAGLDSEVWLATAGGPLWGGAEVWVSMTGSSYSKVGEVAQPARFGALTATLPVGAANDTTNTLSVDLTASRGSLASASAQDRTDLVTASWVDGEVVSYQTATPTGVNLYDLTTMSRGAYGTAIASHTSTKKFARLDDAIFKYVIPASRVGSLLYVKLVSYNIWGGGKQDISVVPAYTFTPGLQVLPTPTAVTVAVTTTMPTS
jgi:hypothetical protein